MNLERGDFERLRNTFPDLGAGPALRLMLRRWLDAAEQGGKGAMIKVDLGDLDPTEASS